MESAHSGGARRNARRVRRCPICRCSTGRSRIERSASRLEPFRGFKSFRLFNSVSLFLKIPFSRVRILAVGKNRKMDRYFFKKSRGEKTGEISRNLPFSRFSSFGSKLTCHHALTGQFGCAASDRILPGFQLCNVRLSYNRSFINIHWLI